MILALAALFISFADLSAQTIIKGVVKDSITGETEPYATIRVFKGKDMTKAVAMSLTDIDGKIRQEVTGNGQHTVTISSMGKMDVQRTVNLSGQREIDLGTVLVKDDSKTLQGVEVVAHKPLVKMETDKMSYNVENDADAKSQTILDMLRKVPMVTVDAQDNISVNGSSNFKVYVDGKPNPMMSSNPSQIFKSIPASMVKNIEVITNPGARFDAEGAGGVLNIVMQRTGPDGSSAMSQVNGYSGTLRGQASTRGFGGGAFLNIQQGKFTISANTFFNRQKMDGTEVDMTREQTTGLGTSTMKMHQEGETKLPFMMANVSVGYEIDPMSSMNATFGFTRFNMQNDGHPTTTMIGGMYGDGFTYGNFSRTENLNQSFTGSIDYQRFFNTERTRQLTISYQLTHSPGHTENWSDFDASSTDVPFFDLTDSYSDSHQKTTEHTVQVDYSTPLAPQQILNTGVKYLNRHNHADSKYYLSDVYNEMMSSDYRYQNNIGAAYLEYDGHWGNWGTKAGVRYEHTWQKVEYLLGTGSDFSTNYGTFVPSGTLSYSFSPTQNLGLSYNMRISRPGISYLNPYINRSDPTALTYGNSDLDVEKTHNVSLVFNSFSSKWMMNATLRHSFCDNAIEQYSFYDSDNLLNTTYGNIVKRHVTSLNFYANWSVTRDTRLMFNGGLSYSDMRSDALDLKNSGWSYNMMINAQQKLPWDMNASLFWIANSKSYTLQGWSTGFNILGLNLSKDIIKDKLSVSVMALTGLGAGGKIHMDSYSQGHDFTSKQEIHVPIRQISLNVSFNFGNLKKQLMRHQSKVNSDFIEQQNAGEQLNNIGGGGMGGGMPGM